METTDMADPNIARNLGRVKGALVKRKKQRPKSGPTYGYDEKFTPVRLPLSGTRRARPTTNRTPELASGARRRDSGTRSGRTLQPVGQPERLGATRRSMPLPPGIAKKAAGLQSSRSLAPGRARATVGSSAAFAGTTRKRIIAGAGTTRTRPRKGG
jgi:hypothetical protein